MDIQAIIDGIVHAGEQQVHSIRQAAEAQVRSIHANAEKEANEQKGRILKDSRVRLQRSQAVIEQRASMQALQAHANSRQKLIVKVIEKTQTELQMIRNSPEYREILQKLILDSVEAIRPSLLPKQSVILHVDKRDKAVMQNITLPKNLDVKIQFDLDTSGGCEIASGDGQVKVLNTFESRFSRALPEIQQELSVLFEEKIFST